MLRTADGTEGPVFKAFATIHVAVLHRLSWTHGTGCDVAAR